MQTVYVARVSGPLAPFADGFRAELDRLGYTPASREYKVNQIAGLSRWLDVEGLGVGDGGERGGGSVLGGVLGQPAAAADAQGDDAALEWLRSQGVIATEVRAVERSQELLEDYRRWLTADRALAARTMDRYGKAARRFLAWRVAAGRSPWGPKVSDGEAVTGYLSAEVARGLGPGSLQGRVAELRSLLRFYLRGVRPMFTSQTRSAVRVGRSGACRWADPGEVRACLTAVIGPRRPGE